MSAFHKRWFILVILATLGMAILLWFAIPPFLWETGSEDNTSGGTTGQGAWLEAREKAADDGMWRAEMLAQACGRTFESLWDAVNQSTNKLDLIADFPLGVAVSSADQRRSLTRPADTLSPTRGEGKGERARSLEKARITSGVEILLPHWQEPRSLPHGILFREPAGVGPTLTHGQWQQQIQQFAQDGWQLENLEFRHNRFELDDQGAPKQSRFYFAARLTHSKRLERAVLEGNLVVDWANQLPGDELHPMKRIDASQLSLKTRLGEPPFQLILHEEIPPPERSTYIDPLMLHDLDGDGLPEIILAGKNLVFRQRGEHRYEAEMLCHQPPDSPTCAVIGDFDGDGFSDFLCANSQGLTLVRGSRNGTFQEPGHLAWMADPPLKNTMALTCGDIDQDGDLDVFAGQYRVPTLGQVLRPFYYDANDGWPFHLLRNDGDGRFTDVTVAAGLGPKRWRRVYSASLVDLNDDGHLDLMVVSDFAGLDLYQNDGSGRFTEVTRQAVAEPRGFGMAHGLADFNADGRLDLLMIGMPSATVDRLEHLGLRRPYSAEDHLRRPAMSFGNRLYLGLGNGRFEQTGLNDSIARSGWSWGCGVADFDNDGFPDVYIANGLESKQSVQEYEPEFWLHDIFVEETIDDISASSYFMGKFSRTRGQGWSYGGYEKNRLFLNQGGESFLEMGHLAGVALEQDCRNVAACDLDGDGRADLLVTTLEAWPLPRQTLRVYRNRLEDAGHWIGFRFRDAEKRESPVGVKVAIHTQGRSQIRHLVTGDSHRSQHGNTLHFGLGQTERVDRVEISWVNGATLTIQQPALDQYHWIQPPTARQRPK